MGHTVPFIIPVSVFYPIEFVPTLCILPDLTVCLIVTSWECHQAGSGYGPLQCEADHGYFQ